MDDGTALGPRNPRIFEAITTTRRRTMTAAPIPSFFTTASPRWSPPGGMPLGAHTPRAGHPSRSRDVRQSPGCGVPPRLEERDPVNCSDDVLRARGVVAVQREQQRLRGAVAAPRTDQQCTQRGKLATTEAEHVTQVQLS